MKQKLTCDMEENCCQKVTHIDVSGFIYCKEHGIQRKHFRKCRLLKSKELKQLESGKPLDKY